MRNEKKGNDFVTTADLWELLDNTRFAIARLRGIELSLFGLTIEQSSILRTLYENGGPLTTKELEDVTMRKPNSISILINRMIRMGLVSRRKSKTGRRYKIRLTREGEDLIKKVTLSSLEMPFSSLTDDEKQKMAAGLRTLLERARVLLGIPYQTPFLKYLTQQHRNPKEYVSE
jgi:DNA-binding MarR family transcriptional regulator